MTNREAIRLIRNLLTMCAFTDAYGEPIDSDAYYEAVDMAIKALERESCGDAVSRSDLLRIFEEHCYPVQYDHNSVDMGMTLPGIVEMLNIASSAQPEQLTDKEQRIFLAAMGREEDVCKQVDAECRDCREPHEDSLVSTCHEITRKVKGALWT